MRRLLPALLLLLPAAAHATTRTAASCNAVDVQAQVNLSATGDTVLINPSLNCPGGVTWSGANAVNITVAITLNGQGTVVNFAGSGTAAANGVLHVTANAVANTFITGFTFNGAFTNGNFPIQIDTTYSPLTLAFRFFGNTLTYPLTSAATWIGVNGNGAGLIDTNTFTTSSAGMESIHVMGEPGNQGTWTSEDVVPGSLNFIYIENNQFNGPGNAAMAYEAFNGARLVFRNNTIGNEGVDGHGFGTEAGNPTACTFVNTRWMEVYNNTWTGSANTPDYITYRGGSGVVFGNVGSAANTGAGDIRLNTDCNAGTYPILNQVGRGLNQNASPLYIWGNGTTKMQLLINTNPAFGGNPLNSTVLQAGRDYFFTTAAAQPTTVKCQSAADVAAGCPVTYTYTPAVYPHPLRGGTTVTPPSPPTGLTGSVAGSLVNLGWTGSAGSPAPTAYTKYRGTVHNGPYVAINSGLTATSTTDNPANGTYFYVMTAYIGGIVSTVTGNGSTATVTCTTNCAFPNGTVFTIQGTGVSAYNGTFTSTGQPTGSTFTFASTSTASASGGGVWQPAAESARSNEVQVAVGAPITLSFAPTSLAFASFTVGTSSPTQTVTVKNTSAAGTNVNFSSISPTGTNPGDFVVQATDPLAVANKPAIDTNCADYPANIWVNGPFVKVLQNTGAAPTCTSGSFALSNGSKWGLFYGTQNEVVDFQVHFHDTGAGTSGYQLVVSAFSQTSPSSFTIAAPDATHNDIILSREAYISVATQVSSTAPTFYNTLGQYPDPLIPAIDPYHHQTTNAFPFTISAGNNQSAWIDVHIPPAAPSGYYSGTVTVQSGCPSTCVTVATLPIIIAVWQWPASGSMPSTATVPMYAVPNQFDAMCLQAYGSYAACSVYPGAGGSSDQAITLSLTELGQLLLDHRIGTTDLYPPYTNAFSGLESNYGPLFTGAASTILPGAKFNNTKYAPGNSNLSFVQNWETEFQSKNYLPFALGTLFNYTCDEPPSGCAWSAINPSAATLHAASPPMPSLVTTNIAKATANGVLNGIDIMVPIIQDLDVQGGTLQRSTYNTWLAGTATSAGPKRLLWTYQGCSSAGTCSNGTVGPSNATWPNRNIDGIPVANRAFEWMNYRNGVSGELYYALTNCWALTTNCTNGSSGGNDPWVDEYSFGGWGDGNLLYPGITGKVGTVTTPFFVPSMRFKAIRDGMQDYEYMNVLANNGQGAAVTSAINSWITNSSTFNTQLSPSGSFTSDLPDARFTLGQAMHQLTFATLCGATLASGASCNVSVTFAPTSAGARSASLTFVDNAAGSPQTIPLSGTGLAPAAAVTLVPVSLTFQQQLLTTSSNTQSIVLQNSGTGTLSISSIAASGDFSQTNTCGATLGAGNTCTITVTFSPTAVGTRAGSISITDNAAGSQQTAGLTGTGIQARCSITGTTVLTGITIVCHP